MKRKMKGMVVVRVRDEKRCVEERERGWK